MTNEIDRFKNEQFAKLGDQNITKTMILFWDL